MSQTGKIVQKKSFCLGRVYFHVSHRDPQFEKVLERLLPAASLADEATPVEFSLGLTNDIANIWFEAMNAHRGCLLVQGACLVTPSGQVVLLSGAPNSGKTTTALALIHSHGWKVLSEDMTIIDPMTKSILSFAAPFNLKPNTRELLSGSGVNLPSFILGTWYPLEAGFRAAERPAMVQLAVHFCGEASQPDSAGLVLSKISCTDQLRNILPISNLLSVGGTSYFSDILSTTHCSNLSAGTLQERVNAIVSASEVALLDC